MIDYNAVNGMVADMKSFLEDKVGLAECWGCQAYSIMMDAVKMIETLVVDGNKNSLNDLRDTIYDDAVAHGLWNEADNHYTSALKVKGEATELVTAAMKVQMSDKLKSPSCRDESMQAYQHDYEMELADCIIMALSVAGKLGIDIDAAVREKMEVNRKRAWQHQGE